MTEEYLFHQTPVDLAKELIKYVPFDNNDTVFEPFKGEGAFYNNLPLNVKKEWCEITQGKDWLDYQGHIDWVITNPPFSFTINDKKVNAFYPILKHFSTRVHTGIALLGNDRCFAALTPKRLSELEEDGLYLHKIVICNVKKWRGRYYFMIFKKSKNESFEYLNSVW